MFEILNRIITVQTSRLKELTTRLKNRNFATSRSSASGFNSPRRPTRWPCSPRESSPWNARSGRHRARPQEAPRGRRSKTARATNLRGVPQGARLHRQGGGSPRRDKDPGRHRGRVRGATASCGATGGAAALSSTSRITSTSTVYACGRRRAPASSRTTSSRSATPSSNAATCRTGRAPTRASPSRSPSSRPPTRTRSTSPVDSRARFFDRRTRVERRTSTPRAAGSTKPTRIFASNLRPLRDAVGMGGLAGLDRLLSFMTSRRLQTTIDLYREKIEGVAGDALAALDDELRPYSGARRRRGRVRGVRGTMRGCGSLRGDARGVRGGGQTQLVRRQLAELGASVGLDSRSLASTLSNANDAALSDVRRRLRGGDSSAEESRIPELARHLVAAGFTSHAADLRRRAGQGGVGPFAFAFTLASLPLYVRRDGRRARAEKKRRGGGSNSHARGAAHVPSAIPRVARQHVSQAHGAVPSSRGGGAKRLGGERGAGRRGVRRGDEDVRGVDGGVLQARGRVEGELASYAPAYVLDNAFTGWGPRERAGAVDSGGERRRMSRLSGRIRRVPSLHYCGSFKTHRIGRRSAPILRARVPVPRRARSTLPTRCYIPRVSNGRWSASRRSAPRGTRRPAPPDLVRITGRSARARRGAAW